MSGTPDRRPTLPRPLVLASAYLAFGIVWIVATDRIVERLFPDRAAGFQTAKGLFFVAGTALVLWALLRFHQRREARARKEADAAEGRYRALVEKSSALVLLLDRRGRIRYASPEFERAFGPPGLDVVGAEALDWVEEGDRATARAALLDRLERSNAPGSPVEVRLRDAAGSWRLVQARPTDLRDDPAVGGVVVHMLDLTDHRRMEHHLVESQRIETLGRLAGGIADDFHTLLAVVDRYVDQVLKEIGPADPLHHKVLEIRHATRRATELVRRLLGLTRVRDSGPRQVDVNEVVSGLRPLLRRVTPESVTMETSLEAVPRSVLADPLELEEVLLNLVLNARDALPRGGTIRIETESVDLSRPRPVDGRELPGGSYTLLRVADDGIGMDAETARRAFDPFFTTKPPGEGAGLGLSTVRGIVERGGGAIHLETALGAGALVEIWLPAGALAS